MVFKGLSQNKKILIQETRKIDLRQQKEELEKLMNISRIFLQPKQRVRESSRTLFRE